MVHPISSKKTKRFNALGTPSEVDDFNGACDIIGLTHPDTVRALANALTTHVKKHGKVSLPIRLADYPAKTMGSGASSDLA